MSGVKYGTSYLKKSCRRCVALIPSDTPSIKEHYKCCLGIQLIWQNVDAVGAFYCPLSPCPKPTTKAALMKALKEEERTTPHDDNINKTTLAVERQRIVNEIVTPLRKYIVNEVRDYLFYNGDTFVRPFRNTADRLLDDVETKLKEMGLSQAMKNDFTAPTGHDNSGGVGRATADAVSTSGDT